MRFIYLTICLFLALEASANALDKKYSIKVLSEINLARCEPRTYANLLREFRGRFQGELYAQPGITTPVQTSEGVKAVDEAIIFLSRQKPLPPLTWSNGLAAAADELAEEQGRSGDTGHVGRQSHSMLERVERHGKWESHIAENIGYGPDDPRNMVMQLIISDGVPDRGHRMNTFSMAFNTAGVACGPHPEFESMCVINFAGGFRE
ncbi:MAG: CAP domain-containing protein [Pseudomonadota bacterium]